MVDSKISDYKEPQAMVPLHCVFFIAHESYRAHVRVPELESMGEEGHDMCTIKKSNAGYKLWWIPSHVKLHYVDSTATPH